MLGICCSSPSAGGLGRPPHGSRIYRLHRRCGLGCGDSGNSTYNAQPCQALPLHRSVGGASMRMRLSIITIRVALLGRSGRQRAGSRPISRSCPNYCGRHDAFDNVGSLIRICPTSRVPVSYRRFATAVEEQFVSQSKIFPPFTPFAHGCGWEMSASTVKTSSACTTATATHGAVACGSRLEIFTDIGFKRV